MYKILNHVILTLINTLPIEAAWPTLTLTYKDVSIRRNRWFTISNKMLYAHQKVQSHAL